MSDKFDVLIVTQFFPPESMGGAHRWEKLAANLDEDIEPHVLTTQPTFPFGEFERRWRLTEQDCINGVPVTRIFTYQPEKDGRIGRLLNYGLFSFLSTLYVLFTFWKYDCVVTMSAPHTTFVAGIVGKLTGRRWFVDIFDLWIDNAADLGYVEKGSLSYHIVTWMEFAAIKWADRVFVITETMTEYYGKKYPDLNPEVEIVPFGIDSELFSPSKETELSTDVIYTGNLGAGQAFEPFFEGFSRIKGEPELSIVGDGERREELEKLTRELNIENQVLFKGYVPRTEIPRLVSGAELSIIPLKTEYQLDYARPTKLLETMAVGTPYIASVVDEISTLSQNHNTGIAVPNDSDAIHQAMAWLLSNDSEKKEMGSNGKAVVRSKHNWKKIGQSVSEVFQECCT